MYTHMCWRSGESRSDKPISKETTKQCKTGFGGSNRQSGRRARDVSNFSEIKRYMMKIVVGDKKTALQIFIVEVIIHLGYR